MKRGEWCFAGSCFGLEEATRGTGLRVGVGDTVTGKDRGDRWRITAPKRERG